MFTTTENLRGNFAGIAHQIDQSLGELSETNQLILNLPIVKRIMAANSNNVSMEVLNRITALEETCSKYENLLNAQTDIIKQLNNKITEREHVIVAIIEELKPQIREMLSDNLKHVVTCIETALNESLACDDNVQNEDNASEETAVKVCTAVPETKLAEPVTVIEPNITQHQLETSTNNNCENDEVDETNTKPEMDNILNETIPEQPNDNSLNNKDTTAQNEEEEGEDVFEIQLDEGIFYATSEENGEIYKKNEDESVGDQVGIIKDGEIIWL